MSMTSKSQLALSKENYDAREWTRERKNDDFNLGFCLMYGDLRFK